MKYKFSKIIKMFLVATLLLLMTPFFSVENVKAAPETHVVLTISVTPEQQPITYQYTGTVPAGAPAVPTATTAPTDSVYTIEPVPTLAGYTFNGWTSTTPVVNPGDTTVTVPAGGITLSGEWTPKTYTVKYDTDGGSSVADLTGVTWEQSDLASATTTKKGFTFVGWFTDAAKTIPYVPTTKYSELVEDDKILEVTLYAKWEQQIDPTPAPTPKPVTPPSIPKVSPNPGRTCQDDGYPAGYTWNDAKQACVLTGAPSKQYKVPNTGSTGSIVPLIGLGLTSALGLIILRKKEK